MDRRAFIGTVAGSFLTVPLVLSAQPAGKVWRIGYIGNTPPMNPVLKQALVDLGYVEGKNAVFEARFTDGRDERYPALATELARLRVDVILTVSGSATEAAKAAAPTTPIVMTGVADPVGRGLVPSLARPGGNVTGIASLAIELNSKRVEVLKAAVPRITRVVLLSNRGGWEPATMDAIRKEQDAAAQTLGVTLRRVEINAPSEFDAATAAILREHPDALVLAPVPLTYRFRKELAEFALEHRLPTIAWQRDQALAGLMMSYGPSNDDMFREAAVYVDKILKGAKPADLPVEQPKKIELIINAKTAKALGVTIPQALLLRADEVIQ